MRGRTIFISGLLTRDASLFFYEYMLSIRFVWYGANSAFACSVGSSDSSLYEHIVPSFPYEGLYTVYSISTLVMANLLYFFALTCSLYMFLSFILFFLRLKLFWQPLRSAAQPKDEAVHWGAAGKSTHALALHLLKQYYCSCCVQYFCAISAATPRFVERTYV